jgi:transglutaminase-like putative cysteine protease
MGYRDYLGNIVHHFDVPGHHAELTVTAKSLIEMTTPTPPPDALDATAWSELDASVTDGDHWEWLMPSNFARPTDALRDLARGLHLQRRDDPLSLLREINKAIHDLFRYMPQSTRVDSPIDDALRMRQGVCQDFTHIFIALARELRVPCRYVSGYLFRRVHDKDLAGESATHAWAEALLPNLGWVGFDPTNNLTAGERHIRVAVGRDYADVPPTRGVFKGKAQSELGVAVQVLPAEAPDPQEELTPVTIWVSPNVTADELARQQQQQQQ